MSIQKSPLLLSILLGCSLSPLFGGAANVQNEKNDPKPATDSVEVQISGILNNQVVAIGAETTGTTVQSGPLTWELDLADVENGNAFAKKHHGKRVIVKGRLEHKKGVEIPERWIVHVESIGASNAKNPQDKIEVQLKGRLRHGIFAIGGETTGTEISASGVRWELDLRGKKSLQKKAARLDGGQAWVKGVLTQRKGVEVPDRRILLVEELKEACNNE